MVNVDLIEEYIECSKCNKLCSVKDLVKVKKKESLLGSFLFKNRYTAVCKECVKRVE